MSVLREEMIAVARQSDTSMKSALRRVEEERRAEDKRALQEWKSVLAAVRILYWSDLILSVQAGPCSGMTSVTAAVGQFV